MPYTNYTVLTDNGIFHHAREHLLSRSNFRVALNNIEPLWAHGFELACARNHVDHRLTKSRHPCTNGQVERMNRTIKAQ